MNEAASAAFLILYRPESPRIDIIVVIFAV